MMMTNNYKGLFANALQSVKIDDLIRNIGAQSQPSAPAAPAASKPNQAKSDESKAAPAAKKGFFNYSLFLFQYDNSFILHALFFF